MLENIELSLEDKKRFKVYAAEKDISMKDLILEEAHHVIEEDAFIPLTDRADDYTSLIIDIPSDFKTEIKSFCIQKDIRIRDLWVECCRRILEGEE